MEKIYEDMWEEAWEWAYQRASEEGDVDIDRDDDLINYWQEEYYQQLCKERSLTIDA